MNDNSLNYIVTLVVIVIVFTVTIASMEHATSIKIDCIKSISKDHYTVDEINKLCGVGK